MNPIGFYTLFRKEVLRFWKVLLQTVIAPMITTLLYLLVFAQALKGRIEPFPGVEYSAFLIPGLMMMAVIQNAFANSSSSVIQSKVTGNIVFILLAPISHIQFFLAFTAAAVVRGMIVGLGILIVAVAFVHIPVHDPLAILAFAVLGAAVLGALGLIAGIWAEKFDQLAGFQNFIIVPLSFLSGVFYSVNALPPAFRTLSHANPFFYMVDGFRYGFFGHSDVNPMVSLAIVVGCLTMLSVLTLALLRSGYKLRD